MVGEIGGMCEYSGKLVIPEGAAPDKKPIAADVRDCDGACSDKDSHHANYTDVDLSCVTKLVRKRTRRRRRRSYRIPATYLSARIHTDIH